MPSLRKRLRIALIATLAAAGLAASTAGPASAAPSGAVPARAASWSVSTGNSSEFVGALLTSMVNPSLVPTGVNRWSCRPSAAHPNPVVLIHGTWENAYDNWAMLAPNLVAQGYCVYAMNYGDATGIPWLDGTGDMVQSANEIEAFVKQVATRTGKTHIDLVGHSQGGSQARYVANLLAPADGITIDHVVGIAPSNHATTLSGIVTLGRALGLLNLGFSILNLIGMPAASQQAQNSAPFYQALNGNGETRPGHTYSVLATQTDEFLTPYTTVFLAKDSSASVVNDTLQDICGSDLSEHISMDYSKNVVQWTLNQLDPSHAKPIRCSTYLIPLR
jgi:pimeloyl-ACP methyl ester carboxylesterase